MEYSITDAREEMLPQLLEIEKECFSVPWTEAMLCAQMASETHIFLAVETPQGEVAGYIGLMFVLDEGYISNVAVAARFRRQGIAEALICELIQRAEGKQLAFLTLEVRESNAPAIALYEKCGFQTVGRRKNYYEKPTEDALLMTRVLRNGSNG